MGTSFFFLFRSFLTAVEGPGRTVRGQVGSVVHPPSRPTPAQAPPTRLRAVIAQKCTHVECTGRRDIHTAGPLAPRCGAHPALTLRPAPGPVTTACVPQTSSLSGHLLQLTLQGESPCAGVPGLCSQPPCPRPSWQCSGWAQSSSLGGQTRSRAPQPESRGPGGRLSRPISRGS